MLQRTTLLGLFLFGSLIAAFPAGVWGFVQLDDRTLGGVQIEGIQVAASDDPTTAVAEIAQAWLDEEVTVRVEDEVLTATRSAWSWIVSGSELAGHCPNPTRIRFPCLESRIR